MTSGAKPWIELKGQIGPGNYRSYATVYKSPLRVWMLGRWIIGRKHVA